jgi:hypothetical protein
VVVERPLVVTELKGPEALAERADLKMALAVAAAIGVEPDLAAQPMVAGLLEAEAEEADMFLVRRRH